MDLTSSPPPASQVALQAAGPSAAEASESPSEGEAPTGEANGLLQEVGEESAELREEPTPAERDGGTPETKQEVEDVICDAATTPAVGPPAGSEGEWQAPTSDSGSPPPRKIKRGRRSSKHRAELKLELEVEQQSHCEAVEEEKIRVEGAGLTPWQSDFDCEDVFRPVASGGRRSVRRSLRNRSGSDSGGGGGGGQGLAWLPPSPTDQPTEPRQRTRGRRLSSGQPL